jgi:hypothetical protein
VSFFGPDFVRASQGEHLPLAAFHHMGFRGRSRPGPS